MFDEDAALGKVVVADFGEARVLDRLLMYERRIESSLYRTMAQLRQEREARTTVAGPGEASRSEGNLPAGQEPATKVELASFGANVVAAGGAEEVPSADGQVSSDGSDFTLQTSHFKLGKITPYGVTTNPPAAEDHGRDARATAPSFHHSSLVSDPAAEEQSCETNPISGGV